MTHFDLNYFLYFIKYSLLIPQLSQLPQLSIES